MNRLTRLLAVVGAATVLALAANTIAIAATGQGLLLGKVNKANKITTVQRTTGGPALKITNKTSASAPFATNGKGKVTNLNADKVDGLHAGSLRTRSFVYSVVFASTGAVEVTIPVPSGSYLIDYSLFFDEGNTADAVQCYIEEDRPAGQNDLLVGYSSINNSTSFFDPALTGSGHVVKTSTTPILIHCDAANGTFASTSGLPMQIVATPTTVVQRKSLVANIF